MKKKFFTCFHPLVLESQTNPTNSPSIILPNHHNKNGLQISKQKRPFSQVLQILLLKASLKMKVLERNGRQLSLETKNARLRRICRRLQTSDGNKTRRDNKGFEEAKVSCSSYDSKNTRSLVVGRRSFDHEERRDDQEFRLVTKSCSSKINPGLYLLVFTLFFTVVWGKVRAVVFALFFLYLFPAFSGSRKV